jgi:hypothetical protein
MTSNGISATNSSTVNITGNVSAPGGGEGVYADGSGVSVTVAGDVNGKIIGVQSGSTASVTVTGAVSGGDYGVWASSGSSVKITGGVTANNRTGVFATENARVDVTGDVRATGQNSESLYVYSGAMVTVSGDVYGGYSGIQAASCEVSVKGSVVSSSADSNYTVYAGNSSDVMVGGDVTGVGDRGVVAETGAQVTVTGKIQSVNTGIRVSKSARVFARGDVIADGTVGTGVNALEKGEATIDGTISAFKQMIFGTSDGALVMEPAKPGYRTYSDGGDYPSFIWLKDIVSALTVAGTATDDTAILQTDILQTEKKTPAATNDKWELNVTSGTVKADVAKDDVMLSGLPAGLDYTAAKSDGNTIVITLTGAATTVLTGDVAVTAVIRGSAVTEAGALDSAGIALKLWYVEPGDCFVLTDVLTDTALLDESTFIQSLVDAGCTNLYEALVYLRDNIGTGAPTALTGRMDALIATLYNDGKNGSEVFTASLSDFTGGNSPVGICADGTFIRADFSAYDYHGQSGCATYDGNAKYTYPLDFSEDGIYMGSTYIDFGGGMEMERDYKAFAVAWMTAAATLPYIPPQTGLLGAADYTAILEKNGVEIDELSVTADTASGTGTVILDSARAASIFAAPADYAVVCPKIGGVSVFRLELPAPELINAQTGSALTLDTSVGRMTMTGTMLKALSGAARTAVVISFGAGDKAGLTAAEQTAVGQRPLVALSLTLDGKTDTWNNTSAPVTVAFPYTPTAEESTDAECLIIWRLDENGPVCVPNGHYEFKDGEMVFKTAFMARFACGFSKAIFGDVDQSAWYGVPVDFIAARGIAAGAGDGRYSPGKNLTRAEYLVMLMRALEIVPDTRPADNFSDAGSTWYTNYLAAARRLGIAQGIGDNRYAPEQTVARQEMFVMLYNALKITGQLPGAASGRTLADFADSDIVAPWAADAVGRLVGAGLVAGHDGKLFPKDTATRAEMAQILMNLLLSL